MYNNPFAAELIQRGRSFLAQNRLRVDYYRIRRSLSYPLPVNGIHIAALPLRNFSSVDYPWSVWLAWALEERIMALGHTASINDDCALRNVAARDLKALAAWPAYRQRDKPDLCLGHCMRTMSTAWRSWNWLEPDLRRDIAAAFDRAIRDIMPFSDKIHGVLVSSEVLIEQKNYSVTLHNGAIIGTIGAALAARAIEHPARPELDRRLGILLGALLDARRLGIHEGVAYDGYVLDFMADWLLALPEVDRAPFLDHPQLSDYWDQSRLLAAPGDFMAICEIGDVEPKRMPFHISAQSKLQTLRPDDGRAAWLASLNPTALRSDALAFLSDLKQDKKLETFIAGAFDVHCAAVLRSGDAADDLAVVMSASSSPMGHIHRDNGSLVIGYGGHWVIADPGYQQYLHTNERRFTIGPRAHNAPLINSQCQTSKVVERPCIDAIGEGIWRMRLDLTKCYPVTSGARRVQRCVWLLGRTSVVVCDIVDLDRSSILTYHWHGHAAAAWWFNRGVAEVFCDDLPPLRLSSPQVRLEESMLDRLPGSRGQLTLSVPFPASAGCNRIWWLFARDGAVNLDADGTLDGYRLDPG